MSAQENHISLDGSMRRVLSSGVSSAESCPSPEIFAAYYEHSLDPEETERYDAHLASCSSCRAILAGVARASQSTTPALDNTRPPRRHWSAMQLWLATAAAGVAAILIVVVLHQRSTSNSSARTAEVAMSRAVASPTPSESTPPASPTYAPAPLDDAVTPHSNEKALSMPATKSGASPQPVVPRHSAATDLASREASSSATGSLGKRPATPPETESRAMNGLSAAPSESGAAPVSNAVGGALAPSARSAQQLADNQSASNSRAMRAQAGAASGFVAKSVKPKAQAPAKDLVITSPNAPVSWTIHTNHVQYSENGQPAPVQDFLPTNSPIAAGSSPGGNVCWLAGADGVVVRTTDGRLWLGTNSPTGSDLTGIKATSAKAATVASADGHTYLTADGGQSWKSQN